MVATAFGTHADDRPKGLMLNLDFRRIEHGLIPNKTLYPLHVPMGDLGTESDSRRTFLIFKERQSLDIPHSILLDPGDGEWIATIRVFARSDGIVMSQGNDEAGYAIYIQDGEIRVAIRSGDATTILAELPEHGTTPCLNQWVSIEVRIGPDTASLMLNRAKVASFPLKPLLEGSNYRIRIGEHHALPAALLDIAGANTSGFTGAISSLKMLRQ